MSHDHSRRCTGGHFSLSRRAALLGLGTAAVFGRSSMALASAAASSSPARLVVINTMGGLDGLSLVEPYADHHLQTLRRSIMAPPPGKPKGALPLGSYFALHPAMVNVHKMFTAGEALAVHAVGNSAMTRSHFEGQDYLQSGAPALLQSGWLDRAASYMGATSSGLSPGIMLDAVTPLLLRGAFQTAGWAPNPYGQASVTEAAVIQQMCSGDSVIGPAIAAGLSNAGWLSAALAAAPAPSSPSSLVTLAAAAGTFLSADGGPCIAAIATPSFDTHDQQIARLDAGLADLDNALQALKVSLGSSWANTVVLTMTEFGRTAYCNGGDSGGTDHGTAFAVLLAGGAVSGGRVVADWPGLSPSQLLDGRDLAPTTDFRSVAGAVLHGHMGLSASAMQTIFPAWSGSYLQGLLR